MSRLMSDMPTTTTRQQPLLITVTIMIIILTCAHLKGQYHEIFDYFWVVKILNLGSV